MTQQEEQKLQVTLSVFILLFTVSFFMTFPLNELLSAGRPILTLVSNYKIFYAQPYRIEFFLSFCEQSFELLFFRHSSGTVVTSLKLFDCFCSP